MRLANKSLLAAAMIVLGASSAFAVTIPALGAGGRTIAGPGLVTMAKTAIVPVLSNYFGIDACVTVANSGSVDVTVDTAGTGTGQAIVLPQQSTSLCQAALTTVTLTCSGTQNGICHAAWRVDR